jgi:hypothetical protein
VNLNDVKRKDKGMAGASGHVQVLRLRKELSATGCAGELQQVKQKYLYL